MTDNTLETVLTKWLAPAGSFLPEVFAVGGAVRDRLLDRPVRDIDIACRQAADIARRLAVSHHPPATVVSFLKKKNVPCFRLTPPRRPDDFIDIVEMRGDTIEEDLGRRDFTINALAVPVQSGGKTGIRLGPLIDPLNGQKDIAEGLIRVCSEQSFPEDPLRILRAARLGAKLDFAVAPGTKELMRRHAWRLASVASERVRDELLALLHCPESLPFVRLLDDTGALTAVFPEIPPMKGCEQNAWHHLDVWGHCLETLRGCEQILKAPAAVFGPAAPAVTGLLKKNDQTALLKLAALLHDAGKPAAKQFLPEKNRAVFHGHARLGRDMAAACADRLRLSAGYKKFLMRLVAHHMRPLAYFRPEVSEKALINWFRKVGDDGPLILLLAAADTAAKAGRKTDPADRRRFEQWVQRVAGDYFSGIKQTLEQKNLVNGHDLQALGMPPGPALGKTLAAIRKRQDQGLLSTRHQALELAEQLVNEQNSSC